MTAQSWVDSESYSGDAEENYEDGKIAIAPELAAGLSALEMVLGKTDRLLRVLFHQAGVGIAFVDSHLRILKANAKFCDLLGYADAELPLLLADLIEPQDWMASQQAIQGLKEAAKHASLKNRYRCRNGALLWSQTTIALLEEDANHEPIPNAAHRPEPRADKQQTRFYVVTVQDISECKQTEAAYQQREAQLSDILNCTNASITRLRRLSAQDYHYDYISAGCQQVFGFTAEEFLANKRLWRSRVFPTDLPQLILPEQVTQPAGVTAEYRFHHKDGSIHWIAGFVTAEWEASSNSWVITAIDIDITDRKRTEAELREKETFLRSIYEGVTTSIFVVDVTEAGDFHFAGLNPAHARIVGLSDQQLRGKTPEQVLPSHLAATVRSHYQQCVQDGQGILYEEMLTFQGENLWWQTCLTPLRNQQGQIYRIIGTSDNITRRKVAELALQQLNADLEQRIQARTAALQESEELFRQFAENIDKVFWMEDMERNLLYVSPSFTQVWGRSTTLLSDNPQVWLEAVHPQDRIWMGIVAINRLECHEENIEYRILRPDGETRWIRERAFPIYNAQGVAYRIARIAEDITEQKQAEVEIHRSRDLFQAVFQESADAVFLVNPITLLILDCNQRAVELFEAHSKAELIGIAGYSLHRSPFSAENFAIARQQLREVGVWNDEIEYQTFRGRFFWGNVAAKVIQVAGLEMQLVRITDISQRKQAECLLQQQANREALLRQMAFRTRESLNLHHILHTSVDRVRDFLQVDRVLIYQFAPDGSGSVAVEAVSSPQFSILGEYFHDPCFSSQVAERYRQGYVQAIEAIETADLAICYRDFLTQLQVKANLVVPILQDERLWGLLLAHQCQESRQWQPFELDLLDQLADQIGIAIRQTNLYAKLETELSERRRAEQALAQQVQYEQLLQSISQQIRSSLRLEEILAAAVTQVQQVLQVDRAIIFRLQPNGMGSIIRAATVPQYPVDMEIDALEEPFLEDWDYDKQGQPQIIAQLNNDHPDNDLLDNDLLDSDQLADCLVGDRQRTQVKSKLVVPIVQSDEETGPAVWGLLILHTCAHYRQWQPAEVELMQKIAVQMGIAIQQSDLYFQLETQLKQKEILIKEVHHRVKNNLQIISAMLKLQARTTQDTAVLDVLEDSRLRLRAIALIHEILYQSNNLEQLNFDKYIQKLANTILAAHNPTHHIRLDCQLQPVCLNLDTAIPCGLLLNELITNAIKHAFPDGRKGVIQISLATRTETASGAPDQPLDEALIVQGNGSYSLTVQDNGVGMPSDLDPKQLQSLGLKIAYDLASQLQGTLTLERSSGTRFRLIFSELKYRKRI